MSLERQVLVVGPSWVGDMIMAQSLFMRLKARSPESVIDVVAPKWSLPLLERMPEVRDGIELDVSHGELGLSRRAALGRELRGIGYARAIVIPRSLKAALVPWYARIPWRTGYRGEWRYWLINDMRRLDPRLLDQTVKRIAALGTDGPEEKVGSIDMPRLSVDRQNLERVRRSLRLGSRHPVVAMMPGAEYGPAKCWPVERFAQLGKLVTNAGADVWVLGSAKESPLGERLEAEIGNDRVFDLCGRTELADAVDLLSAAAVAVTNDSGLMHIAASVGTHVIAIYGSSTPDFTPPLTERKTVLYRRLTCSPCFERRCPLGHLECLRSIEVGDVFGAVQKALRANEAVRAGALDPASEADGSDVSEL